MSNKDRDLEHIRALVDRLERDAAPTVDYSNPDAQAEIVKVGALGWLRFRSGETGEVDEQADLGEEDPRPLEDVEAWAASWNKHGEAHWPDAWILAPKQRPLKAGLAADLLRRLRGKIAWVPVGDDLFRALGPKDNVVEALEALPREAAATVEFGGGDRFMITQITQNAMTPRSDGLAVLGPFGAAEDLDVRLAGRLLEAGETGVPRGLPRA